LCLPEKPLNSLELRKRFFDTAVADVLRAIDGGSLIGANTLSLCVIDYLSYLRPKSPTGGVKENYRSILDDYLMKIDPRYDSARIYALRCALVHTYAEAEEMKRAKVKGYQFKHKNPAYHLSGADGILRLNADTFVADVIWAVHLAFDANGYNPGFEKRGDSLLIVTGSSAQVVSRPYASFHRALGEFDAASPDLSRLASFSLVLFSSSFCAFGP
jgi:hypothetical protein